VVANAPVGLPTVRGGWELGSDDWPSAKNGSEIVRVGLPNVTVVVDGLSNVSG
jgi:hypothetical protein